MSNQNDGQIELGQLPPTDGGDKRSGGISSGCIIAAIVVGVLVICVVPIIVIVVLALLGPAIGNVFSNIVISL